MLRVGILTDDSDYRATAVEGCALAGIDPIILRWTQKMGEDLQQLDEHRIQVLIVQYHHSHHGLYLAQRAVRLGVETMLITSCRQGVYGDDPACPIISVGHYSSTPQRIANLLQGEIWTVGQKKLTELEEICNDLRQCLSQMESRRQA